MIYLNVGGGKSIKEKDIVGIFDMDTSTVSSVTRKLLSEAEKNKRTESPSLEIPKSFVLYKSDDGTVKVCFSQFSSASPSCCLMSVCQKSIKRKEIKIKYVVLAFYYYTALLARQ